MNKNLLRFMFNAFATTKDESKDVFHTIGVNTISKTWTQNGIHGTYSLPGNHKPLFEQKDNKIKLLDDWQEHKFNDEITAFDLLTKIKFDGNECRALQFLESFGWENKTIDNIIFTDEKFDAAKTSEYLSAYGFIRISQPNRDEMKVYINDKGILRDFNVRSDTLSFLSSKIKNPKLKNKLHAVRAQAVAVWQLVEGVPYDLQLDNRHNVYLPFSGQIVKVSANNIEFLGYDKLKLFVPVESMNHAFTFVQDVGKFQNFLEFAITGTDDKNKWTAEDNHNIRAFMSSIGYLLSTYRDEALNKAIIFSDFGATGEERNGRRGKSLILIAISIMRKSLLKPDDSFDPLYRFKFAEFEEFHKVIQLDDVPKNFNYYSLFTSITGGLSCERKGKPATEIGYKNSPKWCITTNFVVPFKSDEQSIIARYAEYQLKPFWSATNEPRKYFGANFFSEDWDAGEWNKFFSFMVRCVQVFLSDGLIEMNIDRRESRYLSYIGNDDAKVEELERIFTELSPLPSFTVGDFIKEHNNNTGLRYDRLSLWTHRTAKRDIDIWIDHHNLNYKYYLTPGGDHKRKSWIKISDDDDDDDDLVIVSESDLPF